VDYGLRGMRTIAIYTFAAGGPENE
jgi:hypothetical protein